jgi:hypothetical protein
LHFAILHEGTASSEKEVAGDGPVEVLFLFVQLVELHRRLFAANQPTEYFNNNRTKQNKLF